MQFPSWVTSPILSDVGYLHDAFYKICPELTVTLHRVATNYWVTGPKGASSGGSAASGRRLLAHHKLANVATMRSLMQSSGDTRGVDEGLVGTLFILVLVSPDAALCAADSASDWYTMPNPPLESAI